MIQSFVRVMDPTVDVTRRVNKLEEANTQLNKTTEDIDERTTIAEHDIRRLHNMCDELEKTMNNSIAEMHYDIVRLRKWNTILTAILSGFTIILIILAYICIGG